MIIPSSLLEPPCIVGIAPCCERVVFASVAEPDRRKRNAKRNAKRVAELIRDGYLIETWTCQQVRESKFGCECKKEAQRAK